ncbi:MAG: aminopeptidase [Candidatus Hermodarchaeota archaeon]
MSSEFEKKLEKYAEVILNVGLNLQKGQRLLIGASNPSNRGTPLELASFVRVIVRKAYQMGARFVEVLWDDPQLRLIRFMHAPRDSFEELATWRREAQLEFAENEDAVLAIGGQDPELFVNQDSELIVTEGKSVSKHFKPVMDLLVKNAFNWTAIVAPVDGWTEKVFPDLSLDDQTTNFWEIIFEVCRINYDDPVSAWQEHISQLVARCEYLNLKKYKSLKLEAPGTDITIGLPKGHIWGSALFETPSGIGFVGNIPTEEVFTLPHRDKTEGVVKATKPLYYRESVIEDFTLTFSKGKVIKATASKGQEFLEGLIKFDEGASRIGEIALIPNSSPISQSGLLFYNSLLDENASCHIALGRAYQFSLQNGEKMSDEEFIAAGGNVSLIHMDFMIGSEEMDIDGITEDGTAEPIIRDGEWAFEV